MSTYVALLEGGKREESIDVRLTAPGVYEVKIGAETHVVDAFRHDYGTFSLIVDTESYSVQLDQRETEVKVHLRDSVFSLEILDEKRLRMRRASGKFTVEGKQILFAPMPGKIVKVLKKAGDDVKEGEGVVVVEAMKMENDIKSPKDGKVVEIHVQEGQAVEGGAKLAAVE
jgi:biotin carboxyl carrier protein